MIKDLIKTFRHRLFWLSALITCSFLTFTISYLFIVPLFKAQDEQSESKKDLLQVYRSLYSYKIENGSFPDTAGKTTRLSKLQELRPYFKNSEHFTKIENAELSIESQEEKFNIILQKKLSNGENDVQILNSNKQFCHKRDGIKRLNENC